MSVTAHLTEMYFAKYKLPVLNFRWLAVGCYFPDGFGLSKVLQLATGSSMFHRDVLFGWTHSLPASAAAGLLVAAVFGRLAGLSFAMAASLHVLMDLGDPLGVKLAFPLSDHKWSLAIWPWSDLGLAADLAAYYVSPASLTVEALCLGLAIYAYRQMTGTWDPVAATKRLWLRERWSEVASPSAVPLPAAVQLD